MPPAVVAAGVTAAGTLGGVALQSRGLNRATDAQERAQREALQYQREREKNQSTRYDREMADHNRRLDEWNQRVNGYPAPTAAAPATAAPSAATEAPRLSAMGAGVPAIVPNAAPPRTLADIAGWNQWNRYGVRR